MSAWFRGWAEKFDALAQRERVLIAVALLGGTALLGWLIFIDPVSAEARRLERARTTQQDQIKTIQAQMAALQAASSSPEAQARAELAALKGQLGELGNRLAAMESSLVPPQRMAHLLESMIGGRSGLRLVSLRTLPVAPVLERKAGGEKEGGAPGIDGGLFKHGIELRLEGSYSELAGYLARLEKLPQKLLWSDVSLSADKHPKLVVSLTVFTLSLDRAWLAF